MFTGIIESCGLVKDLKQERSNLNVIIESDISSQLKIDQSVSHDGVCLTVTSVQGNTHQITAVRETLERSTLSDWQTGQIVNLERAMIYGARLDGHMVQGHVDDRGRCIALSDMDGSKLITFTFDTQYAPLVVPKGSISVNGVSLTVIDPDKSSFSVAIIPYTWKHTNLRQIKVGSRVNLEFDIMGKYFVRMMEAYMPGLPK